MEWFYVDWVTKRLVSLTLMLCLINDSLLTPQITSQSPLILISLFASFDSQLFFILSSIHLMRKETLA